VRRVSWRWEKGKVSREEVEWVEGRPYQEEEGEKKKWKAKDKERRREGREGREPGKEGLGAAGAITGRRRRREYNSRCYGNKCPLQKRGEKRGSMVMAAKGSQRGYGRKWRLTRRGGSGGLPPPPLSSSSPPFPVSNVSALQAMLNTALTERFFLLCPSRHVSSPAQAV
jgi:hypothetical protein